MNAQLDKHLSILCVHPCNSHLMVSSLNPLKPPQFPSWFLSRSQIHPDPKGGHPPTKQQRQLSTWKALWDTGVICCGGPSFQLGGVARILPIIAIQRAHRACVIEKLLVKHSVWQHTAREVYGRVSHPQRHIYVPCLNNIFSALNSITGNAANSKSKSIKNM